MLSGSNNEGIILYFIFQMTKTASSYKV